MVELFTGRVQHLVFTSSSAVYRRSYVQPIAETFRTHAAEDDDPRKAYGVGKVRCEQYLLGEHATTGPAGDRAAGRPHARADEPAGVARPDLLRPPRGRPADPAPGEGFPFIHLVHVADVAALMASIAGNDRAAGQIYNVAGAEITSILGAVQMMARAVGVEPEIVNVPLDIARTLRPPLIHWGEGLVGGMVFSIDKALDDLDWPPQYGVEDGYRHSYEWFVDGGRDHYEFDFSADHAVLEHAPPHRLIWARSGPGGRVSMSAPSAPSRASETRRARTGSATGSAGARPSRRARRRCGRGPARAASPRRPRTGRRC